MEDPARADAQYGLRWEYFSPISEKRDRLTNLRFAAPYTLVGATVKPVSQLYNPDYKNFAPRLGFAYNPPSFNKLVVRGGFGMYYNRVPDVLFANTRGNPPFFARFGICAAGTSRHRLCERADSVLARLPATPFTAIP